MNKVSVYSSGAGYCSVCAPNDMSIEEITEQVNILNPTGIESKWKLSEDPTFHKKVDYVEPAPNPCPCDQQPETRKHYLFEC